MHHADVGATPIDLLVLGAAEVATPRGQGPLGGEALGQVDVLPGHGVAIHAGRILAVAPDADLIAQYQAGVTLDAHGGTVLPGFIDAHTHPVFLGTREGEFVARLQGARYAEIAAAGGGILSTVRGVREASSEQLLALLLDRLDRFLELGTTTVETKSGYGLTKEDELKCLRVLAQAQDLHPVDLVPTFLGAHDVPAEYRDHPERYVDLVCEEMLPAVAAEGLARYCDVFTESHTFGLDDTRRIAAKARELGLELRLHVDQLTPLGGAQLAAELGAASADHLEHVTEEGMEAMAAAGVQPVLCPLVPLFLRESQEAPGRAMVARGLAPALATDFNPGSCYLQSLPEVVSWASLRYGFLPAEGLTAITRNAATSLALGEDRGTLAPGFRADLVVTDLPNHQHLAYELGRSPVRMVVKDGRVVYDARPPLDPAQGREPGPLD